MTFHRASVAVSSRMRPAAFACAIALLGLGASTVAAQDTQQKQATTGTGQTAEADMSKPAPILVIYKEDVKAGRVNQHDQLEARFARTYASMPGARYYLAMNSISGPNESWFLQPYASLGDVEKEYQANAHAPTQIRTGLQQITGGEPDNLTSQQAITTVYREDLSFNASVKDLPRTRYIEVVKYHVQPGGDMAFMEAEKMVRAAYEKANVPMAWATYQVFAGAPSGTYYVFRALDSLAKADPTNMTMMRSVDQALGEDGQKKLMQLVADGHITREVNFYAFNPKTSYPPPEFAAADSFWSQPAQLAQVGTSGKTTGKTATHKRIVKK